MVIRNRRILISKVIPLVALLLVLGLVMLGCARSGNIAEGWAGTEVSDETLFLGSMEGELVAIDISSHNRKWSFELPAKKSNAAFGYAPTSNKVAIYGTPIASEGLVYVSGSPQRKHHQVH